MATRNGGKKRNSETSPAGNASRAGGSRRAEEAGEVAVSGAVARPAPGGRPHSIARPDPASLPGSAESLFRLHASVTGGPHNMEAEGRRGPWLAHRSSVLEPESLQLPPITELRRFNTTRLLPAKYSESVLTRIADNDEDLALIFALDNATNERLLAEGNLRLGITAKELVFGIPHYRIINAAYTHPHPQGGRFSLPYRGAWYAAFELATAKAEVLFHRMLQFAEIGWQQPEELDYDQYLADFCGTFHDLRPPAASTAAEVKDVEQADQELKPSTGGGLTSGRDGEELETEARSGTTGIPHRPPAPGNTQEVRMALDAPDPDEEVALESTFASHLVPSPTAAEFASCLDPRSYIASQQLTLQLMEAGSLGVVYPSARRTLGSCIACFRPSLVCNVRKRDLYRLTWYPDRPATFVRRARQPARTAES